MNNTPFGDNLYDRLPNIYKKDDAEVSPIKHPLKRYLQVMGLGMDYLKIKIDGHMQMYDPDTCPVEFLPYLYETLGFDFPFFMSESEQRSFLKTLPTLYKYKGTAKVFEFLARNIFGPDCDLTAVSREGSTIYIDLYVLMNGLTFDASTKAERFKFFADKFRPVNRKLNIIISMFYSDTYEVIVLDSQDKDILTITDNDLYSRNTNILPLLTDVNWTKPPEWTITNGLNATVTSSNTANKTLFIRLPVETGQKYTVQKSGNCRMILKRFDAAPAAFVSTVLNNPVTFTVDAAFNGFVYVAFDNNISAGTFTLSSPTLVALSTFEGDSDGDTSLTTLDDDIFAVGSLENAYKFPIARMYTAGSFEAIGSYYTFSGNRIIVTNEPAQTFIGAKLDVKPGENCFIVSGYTNVSVPIIYYRAFNSSNANVTPQRSHTMTRDSNGFFTGRFHFDFNKTDDISYLAIGVGSIAETTYWLENLNVAILEDSGYDILTLPVETDSYTATKSDSGTDELYALNTMGFAKTGTSRLGRKRTLIKTTTN